MEDVAPEGDELAARSRHDEAAVRAGFGRMLWALPRAGRLLFGLAWAAAPGATVATVVLQLAVAAATAGGLAATAGALGGLLAGPLTPGAVREALPALALVVASFALRGLAQAGVGAAAARLRPAVRRLAEERVLVAATRVDLAAFDEPEFHDLMVQARDRSAPFVDRNLDQMLDFAGSLIALAALSGTLAVLDPALLPVLVLAVLPQAWASIRGARLGYDVAARTVAAQRRLELAADLLADRATAAELRAFTAEEFLLGEYRRLAANLERVQVRLGLTRTLVDLVGRTASGAGFAGAYGVLAWLLATGRTSAGAAGAAVVAVQAARAVLTRVAFAVNGLYEQSLYLGDYSRYLHVAAARAQAPAGAGTAPEAPAVITVENVTFTYPGRDEPALRDVDLTLRRGEVLALVGENGSGKTTLSLLLAGLYAPDRGAVRWDGRDLRELRGDTVRQRLGVVMQAPARWPLTLRRNVTIGRAGLEDGAAFSAAARASRTDELAEALPLGWQTLLSKRFRAGHDLSGGQWQRVAIARALYRDAPVLVCDEPTAALDARAEAAVHASLRRLARDRAVVLVTHRMVSTRDADRIAVLHGGRIAEYGTHQELMAAGGRYAELYRLQADAFERGTGMERLQSDSVREGAPC